MQVFTVNGHANQGETEQNIVKNLTALFYQKTFCLIGKQQKCKGLDKKWLMDWVDFFLYA